MVIKDLVKVYNCFMFFENIYLTVLIWLLIGLAGIFLAWICFHLLSWSFLFIVVLTVNYDKTYLTCNKFWRGCLNFAYWLLISFSRTHVHAQGFENIPKDCRFMYICNHRSKFDNMIMSWILRKEPVVFISKKENFKIPFVRRLIKRCCYLALDRGNIKSSLETIHTSVDFIKSGQATIGVFPEGTRSKDNKVHDFMPGCFKIATLSKCPVVVCSIDGTQNIHKNFPWKKTNVTIKMLEVLSADYVAQKKTIELSQQTYNIIKSDLEADFTPLKEPVSKN